MSRADMTRAWIIALVGCVPACSDDFDPYSRLSALRVLAIQSTPVAPAPGEVTTLTPLVHVPEGDSVSYAWSWCPLVGDAADGYPCRIDEADFAAAFPDLALPPYELGEGPTLAFENVFDAGALARLCSGDAGVAFAPPDCERGFSIALRLVVRSERDEVTSVRRLALATRSGAAGDNPVLEGIDVVLDGEPVALDEAASVLVPSGVTLSLRARVPESSQESYAPADGSAAQTRERLVLSWFSDVGELDFDRTSVVEGIPLERAQENRWELPRLTAETPAVVVVVVRDDRGGVGFQRARVRLGGVP